MVATRVCVEGGVVASRVGTCEVTPESVAPQPPYHRRLRSTDCKQLHVKFAVLHCYLASTLLIALSIIVLLGLDMMLY